MPTDLRDKLRRLGVHKGAARIKPPAAPRRERGGGIETLVDGREVDTPFGPAFFHEEAYGADHPHGGHALGEVLGQSSAVAAQLANQPALADFDLSRVVFLDTETTGLAGGTGTLVFLVGIGAFSVQPPAVSDQSPAFSIPHSAFHVQQFFLRSPAEEPAMLHALAERLDAFDAVVSFNGRGFDLPLLDARFRLARMRPRFLSAPHLDLLPPARRMWRGRLPSCALSSLEQHILDVRREQADVPGYLIPGMYVHYVESGDASEMPRVLYHNTIDILSMVSLSTRLLRLFDASSRQSEEAVTPADAGDLLALGKWYDDLGRVSDAESALRSCLACQPEPATRTAALHRLGFLLKRAGRRAEAVAVWKALAEARSAEGIDACVELAKHYEWHAGDARRAAALTRKAMATAGRLPPGTLRDQIEAELTHRLERLARKRE